MRPMRKSGICFVGLLSGAPALLAGLFALEAHPIAGVLATLAAMALLLSAATELCQAPGFTNRICEENSNKENTHGG